MFSPLPLITVQFEKTSDLMKSALELESAKVIDLLMLKLHVTKHKDMATDHWPQITGKITIDHRHCRDLILGKRSLCVLCVVVWGRDTCTQTQNITCYFILNKLVGLHLHHST